MRTLEDALRNLAEVFTGQIAEASDELRCDVRTAADADAIAAERFAEEVLHVDPALVSETFLAPGHPVGQGIANALGGSGVYDAILVRQRDLAERQSRAVRITSGHRFFLAPFAIGGRHVIAWAQVQSDLRGTPREEVLVRVRILDREVIVHYCQLTTGGKWSARCTFASHSVMCLESVDAFSALLHAAADVGRHLEGQKGLVVERTRLATWAFGTWVEVPGHDEAMRYLDRPWVAPSPGALPPAPPPAP